jgi:hypothetical protein
MRTLTLNLTAALLVLTACGSSTEKTTAPTPTGLPSPTYDGSTLGACKEAVLATTGKDTDLKHARAGRGFAELSDVPALREVAAKNTGDDLFTPADDARALAAAYTIYTWCIQHHVAKP